jgi:hypothetical protein
MSNQWEYLIKVEPDDARGNIEKIQNWLNGLGQAGWDLIHIMGNCFYFKRPVNREP